MPLEEALKENNELLKEHNALIRDLLGAAGSKAAAATAKKSEASDEDDAPKKPATRKKAAAKAKKDEDADDAPALKDVISKAGGWLGEFKDDENDPETEERKKVFRSALDKLGYDLAKNIDKPEDVKRLDDWLNKKIEAGRLTPEPSEDDSSGDEEDI